ncbi:MAG: hypothetical protein Q9160_003358 [Pyrenula sp. 1 TL-2023]
MAPQTANVLLSTFSGLSLPPTLCLPIPIEATISQLLDQIAQILPSHLDSRLLLSTTSGQPLWPSLESIKTITHNSIISLRLSAPLPGGKGGFGSQLRAAGGRMSSRKKRNQGDQNGSSRNLDGRRLRTITEAKNLAEYLALKPEMDAREKEERKKKWQAIVDAAERKEDEIKSGIKGKGKGLSSEWVEDKEELGDRAREAVLKAMQNGDWKDRLHDVQAGQSSGSSNGGSKAASEEDSDEEGGMQLQPESSSSSNDTKTKQPAERKFFGFDDDDDEFMSDDEDEHEIEHESGIHTGSKGKARAED